MTRTQTDDRTDQDTGSLPSQLEDAVLQREQDGCEACGGDVEVVHEDFDRRHRYTVKCLSRTPCALQGWEP